MDIDWWSKYYASISDYDKSGDYIERGYDKIIVRLLVWFTYLAARFCVNVCFGNKAGYVTLTLGGLSKPRQQRQRERH